LFRRMAMVGVDARADARPAVQNPAGMDERLLHPRQDLVDDPADVALAGEAGKDDCELVAAEPRDGVAGSDAAPQALGQRLEQQASAVRAAAGVELLEMVDVEGEQPDL